MSILEHFQVAEISISYQPKVKASERATVNTSTEAYKVFLSQRSHLISYIEEFNVLFLNQVNKVIGFFNVSKGGSVKQGAKAELVFSTTSLLKTLLITTSVRRKPTECKSRGKK